MWIPKGGWDIWYNIGLRYYDTISDSVTPMGSMKK